ncbi:vWA domain-containing protein [Paracholeplasma manati]|uniref:vWA domain-containing protein n=1 Tax=Paracholeplasma manati TaxID=591373 RepID=UPI002407CC97|nr:vWA domain-containing protein [Paracholeplasma manati]MDG0889169.1 VWA domain-containing protein [Paracholeplasma manati]
MKKDLVELVFILDRSGSMAGLEKETIAGFNRLIQQQKEVQGEALVSTVLFDDRFEVLHNRVSIQKIEHMTSKDYYVRGSTALLDAIGRSILKIRNVHKTLEEENKPEKTLFFITTDGMENASVEFNYERVNEYIQLQKEKYGWEFIFIGANIDAIGTAKKFGIDADRAVNYRADKRGTNLNYKVMNETITELRVNKSIRADWKEDIDTDFKERK